MKENEKIVVQNKYMGFLPLLQIIMIVLKLTNLTDISWWLVFIPIYVAILIIIVVFVLLIIAELIKD